MSPVQHQTEYASPVLRAPSPASSIGTTYGEDQTSFSDGEEQLNREFFEKKWEGRLGLDVARIEEELANKDPLLFRAPEGSDEERKLFEQVVESLRDAVQKLEDNELFEQTLLRGSQAALEQQPNTTDIDTLMRSMMVVPQSLKTVVDVMTPNVALLGGRQSSHNDGQGSLGVNEGGAGVTTLVPGKRSRNGTRRN